MGSPLCHEPAERGLADALVATAPPLSHAEFTQIRRLAYDHFGLDLKEGKQTLIVARLGKTLRSKGFSSFDQYCRHVTADHTGEALAELANALTTNFTSFLREPAHFEFLKTHVAPKLSGRATNTIWSAACSTGEEPYSILFTLLETVGPAVDVRILATDISTRALRAAAEAVFQAERVEALPSGWPRKYFLKGSGKWQGYYRVKSEYRERMQCRRFNLLTSEVPAQRFPAIFCRNVMIYFDKPTQGSVVKRLAGALDPGGFLFIGHSESLAGVNHQLDYVQPAVYGTPGKGGPWSNNSKR
ncbi:Chemotaxis protein methyltransferase 2 [Candidatus Sulfopaludibacter sp. SbA3]|nr:Chemotaxis protein methyltransferase 2 [Candidatus Sulfopaludibacter sp. SbA3]